MASCALLAGIVGGCATSGDLEELGAELKKNRSLKRELQQSQKESQRKMSPRWRFEQQIPTRFKSTQGDLTEQQSQMGERVSNLDEKQTQQLEILRNGIMSGDESVKTVSNEQRNRGIANSTGSSQGDPECLAVLTLASNFKGWRKFRQRIESGCCRTEGNQWSLEYFKEHPGYAGRLRRLEKQLKTPKTIWVPRSFYWDNLLAGF